MSNDQEFQEVHEEIDRAVLLLRSEKLEIERQRLLDRINSLTIDIQRLYDQKE